MKTQNTPELANQLNITPFELEWVSDFLARNEPGLFRFSPRQMEVISAYNGYIHAN